MAVLLLQFNLRKLFSPKTNNASTIKIACFKLNKKLLDTQNNKAIIEEFKTKNYIYSRFHIFEKSYMLIKLIILN